MKVNTIRYDTTLYNIMFHLAELVEAVDAAALGSPGTGLGE